MTLKKHALFITAAIALMGGASAQANYPTRPVTIVVPFATGGDTDVLARMLAEKLSTRLARPFVVENRSGASGTIGSAYVAKSKPDGYTLLLAPNTFAIFPHVLPPGVGASYDPNADFSPVSLLGTHSLFVVVNKDTGIKNMQDLVTQARQGKLQTYASPGSGTPMHILAELFNQSARINLTQIPYRGSAPAIVDLLGGQVTMKYTTLGPVAQHIETGRLVPLAVADKERSPFAPDVPTLIELGYKGVEVGAWQALLAPKGTPPDVINTLNQQLKEILRMPDIAEKMAGLAIVPQSSTPEDMAQIVSTDYERYGRLVKEFDIKAN